MGNPHRAALTLHALPPAEREWLLARLAPPQRALLLGHLNELEQLGIPPDARLIDEALRSERYVPAPAAWRAELAQADAAAMTALLGGEPAGLIARVLERGPWPWAEALLDGLDPDQRRRIAQARQVAIVPRAQLDDWLLSHLAERVRALAAPARSVTTAAPQASRWTGWWRGRKEAA